MTALVLFLLCYALSRLVAAIKSNDAFNGVIWGICLLGVLLLTYGHPALTVR